jgi:NADH:ubiquinone oxidoreductase subunit 4 (subunit M)
LYTLLGSFPLLLSLLSFKSITEDLSLRFLVGFIPSSSLLLFFLRVLFFFSFFIKLPLFGFHLWLPKAHVEAPLIGSIILAAVILKLAIYAAYRFAFFLVYSLPWYSTKFLIILLIGAILSAIVCFTQTDLKALIAYSSVRHMGVVIAGFVLFNTFGISGA